MRRVHVLLLAVGIVFLVPPAASARRVHLTCVDGCLGGTCDIDGRRDGVCTFDLCPSRCKEPVACRPCFAPVAVPLGKSVLRTPGVKFVLLCRRAEEVACLVPTTTTTTTTLPPSPSHLTAFLPDAPANPFFTLSVMGCQAEFPLLSATVVGGAFTCEPSINCPTETGFASIIFSAGFSAEADFLNGTKCMFQTVEVGPTITSKFQCRDSSSAVIAEGSFGFALGRHPPCPPGTLVP
jgi:hypothetical protein